MGFLKSLRKVWAMTIKTSVIIIIIVYMGSSDFLQELPAKTQSCKVLAGLADKGIAQNGQRLTTNRIIGLIRAGIHVRGCGYTGYKRIFPQGARSRHCGASRTEAGMGSRRGARQRPLGCLTGAVFLSVDVVNGRSRGNP